jgi:hypothetical protein
MALLAGYHLQAGSLVLEDGTGSTNCTVTYMSFPEPAPDGFGGHHPAVRRFDVTVTGDSASDLSSNIAALRRECVRGKTLYFRPSTSGDLLSCRIREASVTEREVDMLDRVSFEAELTVTLTTDPYWLAPWGDEVDASGNASINNVPGHIDIPDPGGEVDALLSMRVVPAVEGTGLFVGVKPDPSSDYNYRDDYAALGEGTDDANAYGGRKLDSTGLDSTLSEHWTAPTRDSIANEGRHILIGRFDTDATAASSVTVAARTTTSGSAIAVSTSVDEQEVTLAATDLTGIELGTVQIPAGALPDIDTGSGFADASEGNSVSDGSLIISSETGTSSEQMMLKQTFPTWTGYIDKIKYSIAETTAVDGVLSITLGLFDHNGWIQSQVMDLGLAVGTYAVDLPAPVKCTSGKTWYFTLTVVNEMWAQPYTLGFSYSNGDYADGALTTTHGSGESAGDDLYFEVSGTQSLDFETTNPILAACSESSKTVNLDYVQRIPADFACIAYRLDSSGPLGLYYDAGTDTPYVADADGIGPSVFEDCTINKPLRLKPGVTNRVVFGVLQGDVAVAGMTALSYRIRKRYLTATG